MRHRYDGARSPYEYYGQLQSVDRYYREKEEAEKKKNEWKDDWTQTNVIRAIVILAGFAFLFIAFPPA